MKTLLKLNNEISVDLEKLIEGGMVILANSGGGKSYAIRRLAEQAVPNVQVIILDPEGEFASLREKFDFILCGKDADVPVEVRSASLLATKLLELNKSAIIDLYELHPSERQRYVKLFCESLVNCPKELYHPVLIILDEAHEYVPEGKPSEATWAVEALASKGRKRGQRLILASQRISKLSKNASAECNNKLIGRASQDIDMKRAGDELGFNKEKTMELRKLKPGEFFVFGSAISDDVQKMRIGEVKTTHAKTSYKGKSKIPAPSSVIKQVLGELADLPQEAQQQANTVAELKKENTDLKRENTILKNKSESNKDFTAEDVEKIITNTVKNTENRKDTEFLKEKEEWLKQIQNWFDILEDVGKMMIDFKKGNKIVLPRTFNSTSPSVLTKINKIVLDPYRTKAEIPSIRTFSEDEVKVGMCEKKVYTFLYNNPEMSFTKVQVAIITGYSVSSGGFNNALSKLNTLGLILRSDAGIRVGANKPPDGMVLQGEVFSAEPSFWASKLGACERKIYEFLWENQELKYGKAELGDVTGYSATSGGFNNAISRLNTLGLIKRTNGFIQLNPEILEI